MSSTAEVRWVCLETGFTLAEVLYASGGEGSFRHGVVGYGGKGYGIHFTTIRVSTSGKWVLSVLLEEDFNSR